MFKELLTLLRSVLFRSQHKSKQHHVYLTADTQTHTRTAQLSDQTHAVTLPINKTKTFASNLAHSAY